MEQDHDIAQSPSSFCSTELNSIEGETPLRLAEAAFKQNSVEPEKGPGKADCERSLPMAKEAVDRTRIVEEKELKHQLEHHLLSLKRIEGKLASLDRLPVQVKTLEKLPAQIQSLTDSVVRLHTAVLENHSSSADAAGSEGVFLSQPLSADLLESTQQRRSGSASRSNSFVGMLHQNARVRPSQMSTATFNSEEENVAPLIGFRRPSVSSNLTKSESIGCGQSRRPSVCSSHSKSESSGFFHNLERFEGGSESSTKKTGSRPRQSVAEQIAALQSRGRASSKQDSYDGVLSPSRGAGTGDEKAASPTSSFVIFPRSAQPEDTYLPNIPAHQDRSQFRTMTGQESSCSDVTAVTVVPPLKFDGGLGGADREHTHGTVPKTRGKSLMSLSEDDSDLVIPNNGSGIDDNDKCRNVPWKRKARESVWALIAAENEARQCLLHPSAPVRVLWDVLIVVVTLFTSIFIPLRLVYFNVNRYDLSEGTFGHLMYVCDAAWLVDIALNFRTGFFESGRLVMLPRKITWRYLSGWFFFDLIAACPMAVSTRGSGYAWLLFCLKLVRIFRISRCFSHLQAQYGQKLMRCNVVVVVSIIIHLLNCFWRLALRADRGTEDVESSLMTLYIDDAYWVLMTMSTVGYGDVHAEGTISRAYAILVMLIAPIFSGTIITACTHVTKSLFYDPVESQVAEAVRFMKRRRIAVSIQKKVQENLRHRLHEEHSTSLSPVLFQALSPAVQREMSLALLSGTVLQFPLFRDARHSFVAELAQVHSWVQCLQGDLVVEEGQSLLELIFLVHARLLANLGGGAKLPTIDNGIPANSPPEATIKLESPPNEETKPEVELPSGAWFGEICLFDNTRIRTATVVAMGESELAVLLADEYTKIIQKYPRLYKQHHVVQNAVKDGSVSMTELAFKLPDVTKIANKGRRTWFPVGFISQE